MRLGDPVPVVSRIDGPGDREVDVQEWIPGVDVRDDMVFRAHRYAPDHPGLEGLDLTPGEPIELRDDR